MKQFTFINLIHYLTFILIIKAKINNFIYLTQNFVMINNASKDYNCLVVVIVVIGLEIVFLLIYYGGFGHFIHYL